MIKSIYFCAIFYYFMSKETYCRLNDLSESLLIVVH